ncbi:iron ABC transporter permease [Paenibacillus sp. sptzw28]|uniref:FecCD family ABC transporter permease n=1 Tax=Paenibacillus sp. sptzw28 TaxID=715179 RepID=UPI001C6EC29D|nr:iron ABC transporter permease [Paenibacillus sp. sptzw28]QYR19304.1 iron ABC transporter permease [Paenibacillus sp. sptzw28]
MPSPLQTTETGRRIYLLPVSAMFILLISIFALGIKAGDPVMSWRELHDILFTGTGEEIERIIIREIRVPRFTLGLIIGALLGAAGTLMQGAMNNRLAGPELLGVSAGASLGMAAITVLNLPVAFYLHPIIALCGGLLGGMFVILSARGSRGAAGMLLIGMSVTAILNGLLILLIALGTSNDVNLLYTYLLGSLANRNWEHVIRILPWAVVTLPVVILFARAINLLQLGDETASGLGLKVERTRLLILIVCAVLVAVTVAQCGPIGYISLMSPHVTRLMLRTLNASYILPVSALCGAVMLTAADTAARLMLYPLEIPVGVWTTLVGGICFLCFFLRNKGGKNNHA